MSSVTLFKMLFLSPNPPPPASQTMQTNMEGVYAGGDVVAFPFPQRNNKKVNIPHWQMAHVHGASGAGGGGGIKHLYYCCHGPSPCVLCPAGLSQHTALVSGQRTFNDAHVGKYRLKIEVVV